MAVDTCAESVAQSATERTFVGKVSPMSALHKATLDQVLAIRMKNEA